MIAFAVRPAARKRVAATVVSRTPWLIAVRKFNTSKLKSLLEQRKRGLPSSLCFALEQPNGGYPDVRDIREALLGPVRPAQRRPALGSCNHGLGKTTKPVSRVAT